MPEPLVTFQNRTEALVEWGHSGFHKGGPVKQFDLKVTHNNLELSKVAKENFIQSRLAASL